MVRNNNINNTRQQEQETFNIPTTHATYIQTSNSGSDGEWDNCGDELDT